MSVKSVLALAELEDCTAIERYVAIYLGDARKATIDDAKAATGLSTSTVWEAFKTLDETELVDVAPEVNNKKGRDPLVASAQDDLRAAVDESADAESSKPTSADAKTRIVETLARAHYLRGLSSRSSKQLANATDLSPQRVGTLVPMLVDSGVVERASEDMTRPRWRLVGADAVAPFYAPGTTATTATDGRGDADD